MMTDQERFERDEKVLRAYNEAETALLTIWRREKLTWGEIVGFHMRCGGTAARYIQRHERDNNEETG